MNSKKIKKILAVALLHTVVVGGAPLKANAVWMKSSNNNWNWIENGSKTTNWKNINGEWYYFDEAGNMKTGWVKSGDKWYYLSESGNMKTGWLKDSNNTWYYLNSTGDMKTGWLNYNNNWYYLNENGSMKTGWVQYQNNWYHLNSEGAMSTGWINESNGKWYFADSTGIMQTGIVEVDGKLYALDSNGAMMTEKVTINNIEYTIDSTGALVGENLPTVDNKFNKAGFKINSTNENTTTNNENNIVENSSTSSSSSNKKHHSSSSGSTNNSISKVEDGQDVNITSKGTYGGSNGIVNVKNVTINAPNVVLKNVHITGNLELGEGVGEGDVVLENVTVDGKTVVKGGGENSIHFKDTTLATVIVNKNNGKIRIVVEGKTTVHEVQLESTAKLEESNLSDGAEGFTDINVTESVQSRDGLKVELIGSFETINSRAQQVKIELDETTNITKLVLSVAATVFGEGKINTAVINANGSTISTRPENVVLNANSVSLRDEIITESYSNATSASIQRIKADMSSIKIDMDNYIAGLTTDDFNVSATLDGQAVSLDGLKFDANNQRMYFNPVRLEENIGKILKITVASASEKVRGSAKVSEITVSHGFSGKITDIHGTGISNLTINFEKELNSDNSSNIVAITDQDGYYSVIAEPGQYVGTITGNGIINTSMYASSLSDIFNTNQNETAIRATATDAVKIVLSWGQYPHDEDSHLEGPTIDGQGFHTWYQDKIYTGEDGIRYVDLDWDDTNSYGPETTTIYKLVDGVYKFYVHNFSGDSPLVSSDAKVQIYEGNSSIPKKEIKIDNDSSKENERYWYVFEMKVEDNGKTIDIKEINELRESMTIRKSSTAESSYRIDEEMMTIYGVPDGTIADLKQDILPNDGEELKVFAADKHIYTTESFNSEEQLKDSDRIEENQIVVIKQNNGAIKRFRISLDLEFIDKSPLFDLLKSLVESDYTVESWNTFKIKADEITSRVMNTQEDVRNAIHELEIAIDDLVRCGVELPEVGGTTTSAAVSVSNTDNDDVNEDESLVVTDENNIPVEDAEEKLDINTDEEVITEDVIIEETPIKKVIIDKQEF